MTTFGFSKHELRTFRSLKTPQKIQRFLDDLPYNLEPNGQTCRSPRRVLRDRTAHCAEGAMFGAAALRLLGFPPLILDLESVRDVDHILAVFHLRGGWGAIAKSNFAGLRYREPVYRTLRELALSYFDDYYNYARERSLRGYSRPVNLARFDRIEWMTREKDVWEVPTYLCEISHVPLLTEQQERHLTRLDRRSFLAGQVGRASAPGEQR